MATLGVTQKYPDVITPQVLKLAAPNPSFVSTEMGACGNAGYAFAPFPGTTKNRIGGPHASLLF